MRAAPGHVDGAVISRLLADPGRYGFFQAVRLLLLWLEEQGVPARQAWLDHLRFPNSVALGFPAGEVEALRQETLPDGAAPRFRLTPTFMGLLGVHGALPWRDTERITAAGDAQAAQGFLDIFSTRLLALFYEAWTKYRVDHAAGQQPDALLPLLLALAGMTPAIPHEDVDDATLALHAGVLRARPLSGPMLARVLADQLHAPVAIEQGAGHWDWLAPDERNALGRANAHLGCCAMLGGRAWRPDLRVRVRIGPLDAGGYAGLLPGARGARVLRTLLRLFATPTLAYEIVLVLRRADVAPLDLAGGARRLGLDSFLLSGPAGADRADLRYVVRPLAPIGSGP